MTYEKFMEQVKEQILSFLPEEYANADGGDFCGGRGYRESPQLVERKLFRNDLGQCESQR